LKDCVRFKAESQSTVLKTQALNNEHKEQVTRVFGLFGEERCTGLLLCDFQWYQKKKREIAKKENASFANISERKGKEKKNSNSIEQKNKN